MLTTIMRVHNIRTCQKYREKINNRDAGAIKLLNFEFIFYFCDYARPNAYK